MRPAIVDEKSRIGDWEGGTISKDKGWEFRDHARVAKAIKADICFARPYASNQRGPDENINGHLRPYLPRSRRFDN